MNILNVLARLRDDIKTWVTNNINVLNTKINNKVDSDALPGAIDEAIAQAKESGEFDTPQADWNQTDEKASDYIKNKPFEEGKHIYIETSGSTLDTTFIAMDITWAQLTSEVLGKDELLGCVLTAHFPDGTSSSATVAESNIIAEYDNGIILLMLGQVYVWVCFTAGEHTASNGEITVNATVPAPGVYIPDYFLPEMSAMEMIGATKMLDNKYLSILNVDNDGECTIKDEHLPAVPHFNLIEMGLGDPSEQDSKVSFMTADTTEIRAALEKGPVKFTYVMDGEIRTDILNGLRDGVTDYIFCFVLVPINSWYSLAFGQNDILVGINTLNILPDVTADDNSKVLTVVDGSWAAAEAASGEIPAYDLTAIGLPTVEINGEVIGFETDTSQIVNDLANGNVKLSFTLSMSGEAVSASKIVNALMGDALGGCNVTTTDMMGDMVAVTNIFFTDGMIVAKSYTLDTLVNPYIDAYIDEALGGDY